MYILSTLPRTGSCKQQETGGWALVRGYKHDLHQCTCTRISLHRTVPPPSPHTTHLFPLLPLLLHQHVFSLLLWSWGRSRENFMVQASPNAFLCEHTHLMEYRNLTATFKPLTSSLTWFLYLVTCPCNLLTCTVQRN